MFRVDTLKGRVAFITGGGGGIGLEIASCYARLGASVAIAGRNEERLQSGLERDLTRFVEAPFSEQARFDWQKYREVVATFTRMRWFRRGDRK